MSFSEEMGYVPIPIESLLDAVRVNINAQFGTTYTAESFVGTNWYKFFYAIMQRVSENETKTAEVFLILQQYFAITNELIQRPSVSAPGIVDALLSNGFTASVKPPETGDAGKAFVCLDLDDGDGGYAVQKLQVCTLLKNYITAGIVTQGTESESIVLSNGQSFDFKFNLPDRIPILLKLTITESENNILEVLTDEVVRQTLFDNINARYKLGLNFQPMRYFNTVDAPWAGEIHLEYSIDAGMSWVDDIFDADYDELYTFGLEDIEVVFT